MTGGRDTPAAAGGRGSWGWRDIIPLVIAVLVCQSAGLIGTLTGTGETGWYRALEKPAFTPPGWVFAPVWITLYTLMGVAAWLVWRRRGDDPRRVRRALTVFGVKLVLNAAWTLVFFGAQLIFIALLEIIALAAAIAATIWLFYPLSRVAAWLMVPYLMWVCYATALNAGIVAMNR